MRGLLVLVALVLPGAVAQSSLSSRYLLGFAACSGTACRESLVQSSDGVRWTPVPGFAGGTVRQPSLVRRGPTLYLLDGLSATPSGLTGPLRRFRTQGTLSEQPAAAVAVQLANPGDAQAATALTAVPVLDDSGALALVYALTYPASTNACPTPGTACVKLRSATETQGSDGTAFAGDPGNRVVLPLGAADSVASLSAFRGPAGWLVLLTGPGGCIRVLSTKSLRGTYGTLQPCLARGVSTASGFYNQRLGEYWLYGESGGAIVRAVATRLDRPLKSTAFRPLAALGSSARNPSFAAGG